MKKYKIIKFDKYYPNDRTMDINYFKNLIFKPDNTLTKFGNGEVKVNMSLDTFIYMINKIGNINIENMNYIKDTEIDSILISYEK